MTFSPFAFITGLPGYAEILIVVMIGLLLFGRRLPEVGRSLGRTIVEFKKGIRGIESEIDEASSHRDTKRISPPNPPPEGTREAAGASDESGTPPSNPATVSKSDALNEEHQ